MCILLTPFLKAGFVLGMAVGGSVCVAIYRRRQPFARFTSMMGARLGAAAGVFGFVVYSAVQALVLLAVPRDELRKTFEEALQQAIRQNPDPKVQEIARGLLTPEGMAAMMIFGMVLLLAMFVIFGVVGGGLAASLGRRDRD